MKTIKFLMLFLVSTFFMHSCTTSKKLESASANYSYYGEKITPNDHVEFSQMMNILEKDGSYEGKVLGTVTSVCQKKGCWMTLRGNDLSEELFIKFKDYGFFMPFDLSGKKVIIRGTAQKETTSVELLKHYAMDGGSTEEEISKITEPETAFNFIADGVVVLP